LFLVRRILKQVHRKKIDFVVAANQVFDVETKSTGTVTKVSAPEKLAARVVANIMPPSVAAGQNCLFPILSWYLYEKYPTIR
jgi:hypothetical protein